MKKISIILALLILVGCGGDGVASGGTNKNYPTLREMYIADEEIDRESVLEINVIDTLSDDIKGNATFAWDVSEKQDKSITAYFNEKDGKLYVCGNGSGKIYANPDSRFVFCGYRNCKDINGLEMIDTSKATTMASMFANTTFGKELAIENWDTSNVNCMSHMFERAFSYYGITPNISNWNTSKLEDVEDMFKDYNTINDFKGNKLYTALREYEVDNVQLEFPDFTNWDVSHITEAQGMFENYGNNRISYTDEEMRDSNWEIKGLPNFITNFIDGTYPQEYIENMDIDGIIKDYYPCVETKEVYKFKDVFIKTTFLQKIGNYNKNKIEFE